MSLPTTILLAPDGSEEKEKESRAQMIDDAD